jgi:hypothetical protein
MTHLKLQNMSPESIDGPPTTFPAAFRLRLTPLGPDPIHKTEPQYSEEARAPGLEGTVFVSLALGPVEAPGDLQVKSPLGPVVALRYQ